MRLLSRVLIRCCGLWIATVAEQMITGPTYGGKTLDTKPLFVRAEWDDEADVWVATSDDVPGLATEETSMEDLVAKLKVMIPELLEANGLAKPGEVPFELLTRRFDVAVA